MVCKCSAPAPWKLKNAGKRRLGILRRTLALRRPRFPCTEHSDAQAPCAAAPGATAIHPPAPRRWKALAKAGSQPRRVYLIGLGGRDAGAVCWDAASGEKATQCMHGIARFQRNCATSEVAAFDAEWTWHRPDTSGVALLQIGFWPSREVFCIRLRHTESGQGELPPGLRRLFARGRRREVAMVGFALFNDALRLKLGHNLSLNESKAADLQPWCSEQANRLKGFPLSLRDAAWRFLGLDVDKGPRLSDWEGTLTHAQLRYAAADAWLTLRLFGAVPRASPLAASPRSWEVPRTPRVRDWREFLQAPVASDTSPEGEGCSPSA